MILNKRMKLVSEGVGKMVGKEENVGCQCFLLFPQYFQKTFLSSFEQSALCGKREENIVGDGDVRYKHCLFFPQCFQNYSGSVKRRIVKCSFIVSCHKIYHKIEGWEIMT